MTIMTHLKDLKDDFHSETVLSILNEQRIRGVLCDVTIIVEDTKFKAHSNVLAASSLYFKNIFWSRAICISGHVLELDDLKADVFTEILNYIYNSTVMVKRQDIVLDLAAAGKKLGISFLEDLTDKNISNSPCLYSFCNTEKGEVKEEKRQEDSAITNGPRITNAYSIFETENCGNLFSPLDLRASFKKLPETNKANSVGPDRNDPCKDLERTSTLAEHSYAVTTGCDTFQQNSSYHINSPLCKTGKGDSDVGLSVSNVKATTQIFSTAMGICNSHTTDTTSVQVSTHKVTNAKGRQKVVTDQMFLKKCHPNNENRNDKDENKSGQVSGSIAAVIPSVYNSKCHTNSFKDVAQCNIHLQFHSQSQEPLVCKYCSKQFESATELEAHEDVCRGLDSCENEQNPSDTLVTANEKNSSSYINQEPMVTDNELTDYSATNCTMPETEHFVKVVDGQILYSCNVCRRTYVTLSSLRRHSNVHSWRRTYPCHYCNKVFALAEYRTRHEIWHTGERRYQCIFCLETFMTYYILKNHQKSFHAIDHQLGGNKKTANGGLKPSVYPYKLYRLLPMKSKKSPYKTHETSSYENIQASVQVNEAPSSTCTVQNTVASELPLLDFPSSMLPNTTVSLDIPCRDPTLSPMNPANVSSWEAGMSKIDTYTTEAQLSSTELHSGPHGYDSYLQNVSSSTTTENSTSVINYNSSAPSVIVHSGRVSSVIMHSNAVSTIGNTRITDITASQVTTNDSTHFSDDNKSNARISSREKNKALSCNREETLEGLKHMGNTGLSSNTSTDMSSKTETYIAKPALPGTSADRNIAPLCQITVKIGNEAIVKRHILGSKIFYKKGRRSKHETKEDSTLQVTERETRERSVPQVSRSEYLELSEMCDDVSDHDSNDKPWRPYYNYKPKKKSKQLRKTRKAKWRERYSSRNPSRASEKTYVTSYALRKIPEENIPNQEDECEMSRLHCEEVPSKEKKQDHLHWDTTTSKFYTCQLCQKHFQSPSALRIHMQCHPGEKPYPCKTCGKSFSVSGNLQKHECTHSIVKDFICQYCNKAFSLKQTLKIHERIHTGEKRYHCQFCLQSFLYLSTKRNHEQKHKCEQNGKGFACFQCPKVCKTAAALGMHQKKHLFKNPKQENKMDYLLNESTKSFESQYSVDPQGQKEHKPLLTPNVIDADGYGPSTTSIVDL